LKNQKKKDDEAIHVYENVADLRSSEMLAKLWKEKCRELKMPWAVILVLGGVRC
jgi:hypothetical protein